MARLRDSVSSPRLWTTFVSAEDGHGSSIEVIIFVSRSESNRDCHPFTVENWFCRSSVKVPQIEPDEIPNVTLEAVTAATTARRYRIIFEH